MKPPISLVRRCAIALVVSIAASSAPAQQPAPLGPGGRAWFRPYLGVDEEPPTCASLLQSAQRVFDSVEGRAGFAAWSPQLEAARLETLDVELPVEGARAVPLYYVTIGGRRVYLVQTAQGGCGSTCDSHSLHASLRSLPEPPGSQKDSFYKGLGASTLQVPAYSYSWLKSADGAYYVGYAEETLGIGGRADWVLARLGDDGAWRETCRVHTRPADFGAVDNERVRAVLAVAGALDVATRAVLGAEGDCGSLHALALHGLLGSRLLEDALVRPWAFEASAQTRSYAEWVAASLADWGASGLYEQAAFESYERQLSETAAALASFYVGQFGWPAADAESAARTVISAYAASAFAFSGYDHRSARELRAAILGKQSVEELRKISVDLMGIDGVHDERGESALNAAVTYPEALRYLLELGADPNKPNAFGKTPLMYAAQHDAYDAALLLLDHGAEVNAWTTDASDSCYYQLRRTNVTPLHYAIRYASARFVRLLLDRGAAVYVGVVGDQDARYPIDWLHRYVSEAGGERNAYIDAREVPGLERRLALPSEAQRDAIARRLTIRAEADYAAGDAAAAYRTLALALNASPANRRAMGDMPLVALRAGEPDAATAAALALTRDTTDSRATANAWFNYGLACDALRAQHAAFRCGQSLLMPYLRSWRLEPTAAREAKVAEIMTAQATCVETKADGAVYHYLFTHPSDLRYELSALPQQVYVMHPRSVDVSADAIHWRRGDGATVSAQLVTRDDFGDFAITLFVGGSSVNYPASIGTFACSPAVPGE